MFAKKIKKIVPKEESEESTVSIGAEERSILNSSIKPPYNVLLDTNFINDCIRKKLNMVHILIDCLEANVQLFITECVYAELEKLGRVYRLALNMIKKTEHTVLKCQHKGTYADDCILKRISEFKCYIVATSDTNLRQRIKKHQGVPIVFFRGYKLHTERLVSNIY